MNEHDLLASDFAAAAFTRCQACDAARARQGALGESTSVLQSKLSRGVRAPSEDLIVATRSS